MRALVIYCHPSPTSLNAAVRDLVVAKLTAARAEVRLHDLYAEGFQPVLTGPEWAGYLQCPKIAIRWPGRWRICAGAIR